MEDCEKEVPSGKPAIGYYRYTDNSATITIKEGGGPRTGFVVEYGENCENFSQSVELAGDVKEHSFQDFNYREKVCFRIREKNECALGEWSSNFDAAVVLAASDGEQRTEQQEGEKEGEKKDLPVTGAVSSVIILLLGMSFVVGSWWLRKVNN